MEGRFVDRGHGTFLKERIQEWMGCHFQPTRLL